jgi:DNA-binding MarR family transcriptional regulator
VSLGDGQGLAFPCGFAAVDARLVTPLLRGLSPVELRVYMAAVKHCRGRGVLVTTRQLGGMAGTDQARVVPALRQLEALHLLRCHRSPRGTRIEVLSDIPKVIEALQQRRERGPDAPASRSAARTGPVSYTHLTLPTKA